MKDDFLNIHPQFKLNGRNYTADKLVALAEAIHMQGDEDEKEMAVFILDWLFPKPYLLVNTSGSTGKPKSIRLEKEKMIESAKATGEYFDLHEGTKALLCLSPKYIGGKMMLVRAMMLGWHLDVVVPNRLPLSQTKENYDFAAMIPLQVRHSLKSLGRVKKVIIGGGEIPVSLLQQLKDVPTEMYATYGMTETASHVAVKKLNHFAEGTSFETQAYEALPGIEFSQDQSGCLVIDAPRISVDKIVTHDVVALISNTRFEWLGRLDNVINSGGVKIHPEIVERKLSKRISKPFFVASKPDEEFGEQLILVIEGEEEQIDEATFSELDRYEVPKQVFFLSKFIYSNNEKLRRKETVESLG